MLRSLCRVSRLVAPLLIAAAAHAQGVVEVLEVGQRVESRLLDAELERYDEVRGRAAEAAAEVLEVEEKLDQAIRAGGTSVAELRRMERDLAAARESATAAGRELIEIRRRLYERMERMAELEAELEEARARRLVPPSRLDGFWELELQPTGDTGLLELRAEGTLITGTYRFGNGGRGSVRGTVAGNRVDLEKIDADSGFDAVFEGEFQPANLSMRGRWTAVDVSGGRYGGGTWRARKLSPAEEERLELP